MYLLDDPNTEDIYIPAVQLDLEDFIFLVEWLINGTYAGVTDFEVTVDSTGMSKGGK